MIKIIHEPGFTSVETPSVAQTASIKPREAALTPSRKPAVDADFRNLGTNGLIRRT